MPDNNRGSLSVCLWLRLVVLLCRCLRYRYEPVGLWRLLMMLRDFKLIPWLLGNPYHRTELSIL